MPGKIEEWGETSLKGWAHHPAHRQYHVTVHVIADGRVLATCIADDSRKDGLAGFSLPVSVQTHPWLHVMIGETGETFTYPARPERPRLLTVEELIATPGERSWITGACVIEAQAAGLLPQTIIDLLCHDHLGRPAGPVVTATALRLLSQGGYDSVRRMLIESSEYRARRIHADRAPGSIFSQPMVLQAGQDDFLTTQQLAPGITSVSAARLLELADDESFITACYRQILRKEPDRAGFQHYVGELANGISRLAIIRHLGNEFETISAGILITDLPVED